MMAERTIYSHYTDKELVDSVSLRTNLSTLETELLVRVDKLLTRLQEDNAENEAEIARLNAELNELDD